MSTSTLLAESTNKRKSNAEDLEASGAAGKKTTTTTTTTTTKPKSPHDVYMENMSAFMKEKGYMGSLLVKGIGRNPQADSDDDEDDEDEEDQQDSDNITQEQMDCLRFVLITQNRADKLEEMQALILGDQNGASFMMFNTSFSYTVHDSLEQLKSLLKGKANKTPAQKLDLLFAYTHTVKEYDVWMHDNEGDMGDFTKGLAAIWKRLLKGTNGDLGIDAEFTKPALEEFLHQFQTSVESVEAYDGVGMKFKYK
jgi:hypothetical protein